MDQFADGCCRVVPKVVPNSREALDLPAVGSSFGTLAKFDSKSDKQGRLFKTP